MNRKLAVALTLTLLVGTLNVALNVQKAKASGTIYIRADGSIDPFGSPISTVDNVTYTLTGNIVSDADGIVVERSNIIIDGAGYTVEGTGDPSSNGLYLSGINNVTIKNMKIKAFNYGILLASSSNYDTISGNNITNNRYGIGLSESSNNTISGNNITANDLDGICLYYFSDYNVIAGNNVTANNGEGIWLSYSSNNQVAGNDITNNGEGIGLSSSSNNCIAGNNVTNHSQGIRLYESSNNILVGNNLNRNVDGMLIYSSSNNRFYHNNFISNILQLFILQSHGNTWDDGYPFGGNYWSNYTGVDFHSGPYQNETGSDGMGDEPYIVDVDNIDDYPLMRPWTPFEGQVIYIRADGNVDPSGAPLQRKGDSYTLTSNITSNSDGVVIERDNVIIDGNGYTLQGSASGKGFVLSWGPANVTIKNTNIKGWTNGLDVSSSSNNNFLCNNITNNDLGIYLSAGSSNNIIADNVISESSNGIQLTALGWNVSGNKFVSNKITNNYIGIIIDRASGNIFYHNNFVNNTYQVWDLGTVYPQIPPSSNIWDNGYPSGGNYWSDYTGVDFYAGPYQNETGSDGIGDTSYVILVQIQPVIYVNQDHYPLMYPWSSLPVHNINTGLGYGTIQEAIDAPETLDGHTVFVEAGTYYENVYVNKGIFLIGEKPETTIIDHNGTDNPVDVVTNDATITRFTIQNGEYEGITVESCLHVNISNNIVTDNSYGGIYLSGSSEISITNNTITKTGSGLGAIRLTSSHDNSVSGNTITLNQGEGISVWHSTGNELSDNNVYSNLGDGIHVEGGGGNTITCNMFFNNSDGIFIGNSDANTVMDNIVSDNSRGLYLVSSSSNVISDNYVTINSYGIHVEACPNNTFYHNNLNNTFQVRIFDSMSVWDDGYPSGGNYWSDYTGVDLHSSPNQTVTGSDSIGDTPYAIDENNVDNYPLMAPYGTFDAGTWNEIAYSVDVVSNSTVSGFHFNPQEGPFLKFNVTGQEGTVGFCRIAIPKSLLWAEDRQWIVFVGGVPITNYTTTSDQNCTYLYFTYGHSTKTVQITGTKVVVPEFPSFLILPLFMMATLLATIVWRKKRIYQRPL
jgi:parallel beta-helix repeat protein